MAPRAASATVDPSQSGLADGEATTQGVSDGQDQAHGRGGVAVVEGNIADNFDPSGSFRGEDLQQVKIAPKQGPSAQVQIMSVELYGDGVVVRYRLPGGMHPPEVEEEVAMNPLGAASFMVTDDLGTKYRLGGGTGGGSGEVFRGEYVFTPAVPEGASTLTITSPDGPVDIDLG